MGGDFLEEPLLLVLRLRSSSVGARLRTAALEREVKLDKCQRVAVCRSEDQRAEYSSVGYTYRITYHNIICCQADLKRPHVLNIHITTRVVCISSRYSTAIG